MIRALTFALTLASASAAEDAAQVMTRLIANYGSNAIRPQLTYPGATDANSGPEVVDVQFYIAQLRPLDTRAQDYGFDGYMRAWWHDPRLAYNGTDNGGAFDNLNLGAYEKARIWKPEFYWEGARTIVMPNVDKGTGELIWVSPDGSVWWSRQTAFIVSCPFASGTNLNHGGKGRFEIRWAGLISGAIHVLCGRWGLACTYVGVLVG